MPAAGVSARAGQSAQRDVVMSCQHTDSHSVGIQTGKLRYLGRGLVLGQIKGTVGIISRPNLCSEIGQAHTLVNLSFVAGRCSTDPWKMNHEKTRFRAKEAAWRGGQN